ncbi:probable DNA helicase MCM9 [Ananas comosus]|uniref:DNA helicase n=1 Tax=Ananas comosus TaxID=4615 RepID=A0A6P5EM30_ANACO|nr:probable DNA helicase MCM9 [Ananas comosus]
MAVPGNPDAQIQAFASFLLRYHSPDLRSILLSPDPKLHYPLIISFAEILEFDPRLAHHLFSRPSDFLPLFDEAALRAHRVVLRGSDDLRGSACEKAYIHVRINVSGSPLECPETFPSIGRVRVKHRGFLLTLKGTVIRSGAVKMIEGEREYQCRKCRHRFKVYPEMETGNRVVLPTSCPSRGSKGCEGTHFQFVEDSMVCHDYQDIKIQESAQLLDIGSIPRSIPVVLMDDLVDIVKAGDDVVVTGVLSAKWSSDLKDVRCDLDPVLVANFVWRTNELKSEIDIPDDVMKKFKQFWSECRDTPLRGRNTILQGICPQIFGLFTVKLAVALTLIGGVQHVDASGMKIRGEPHMLLVGDPGTGKSQFLKFAAKLSNRSVITTGLGSTSAGLTVTAVKDGGEWMLEAGALVLADGGLCCIDEFDRFGSLNYILSISLLQLACLGEAEKTHDGLEHMWSLPMIRRYIHYVKQHFKPVLTKESEKVISSYYQLQRRSANHNVARTTVRMLESLIRLAQAHARLMFRDIVTQLDAIAAILCIESSMTTSAIVDSVGNALHSNFTDNPDQECILTF